MISAGFLMSENATGWFRPLSGVRDIGSAENGGGEVGQPLDSFPCSG